MFLFPFLPKSIIKHWIKHFSGFPLQGTGLIAHCIIAQQPLLGKNRSCSTPPCSIAGKHQPAIRFDQMAFYGLSEYYYIVRDLLGELSVPYLRLTLHNRAQVCRTFFLKNLVP
ncbi:unnamed protein product [Protopolystoma xenopodis]|uniref:Uncharacterized protein n=1 Tax=Protopolystoma xenopodis TaxID=117903 RepID=A0A448X983_9PLAT|nr:unnamed protein product [Protopolystoma xenopodis]